MPYHTYLQAIAPFPPHPPYPYRWPLGLTLVCASLAWGLADWMVDAQLREVCRPALRINVRPR